MPRDGLSQYAPPPGTNGITNYTIESTKYNGFVADVTQDLNLPRPIVAGGTGANNARDAMTSLQGDVAYQVVTNYDAYAFVSGSFYSAAGATSAPTGNAFIGQCYTSDPAVVPPAVPAGQNMFIEARDVTTGLKYLRQKTAGVWGAWKQLAGSVTDLDAAYVNVTGDNMTGTLTISTGGLNVTGAGGVTTGPSGLAASVVNCSGTISVGTAGAGGSYYFGNSGTKYLNYDGTQYSLVGGALYTGGNIYANGGWIAAGDAGSSATKGTYYFGGNLNKSLNYDGANFNLVGGSFIVNNATAWIGQGQPNATIYFGSTGTKYLSYDGTNFNLTGGALSVSGPVVASGVVTIANTGTGATNATLTLNGGSGGSGGALTQWLKNGTVKWYEGFRSSVYGGGSVSDNYMIFNVVASTPVFELDSATKTILLGNGTGYIPASACAVKVAASGGGIQYGIGIGVQADNTNLMVFSNSGNVNIGSISETAGAVAFNTSSSGELKEDLKSFDAGNIIDATDVYDFKWKKTGERAYGVIAQQAVEVYPMAVTHSQQDGQEDDFWGVDYSKYVPVLLQELKALRARVAQLEGRATAQPA